jgi:hypothetical protein
VITLLIAALAVGAIVAYHIGLKAGTTAAVTAGIAFLAAWIIPPLKLWIYLGTALAMVLVSWIGSRREKPTEVAQIVRTVKRVVATLRRKKPTDL